MSRQFDPYTAYANPSRTRIDARPKNRPTTHAGMTGMHFDTRGNPIGGYTAEGEGIGTKGGQWKRPLPEVGGMPQSVAPSAPMTNVATPAATVNPNATPLGQKRSWRDGGVPGTIGREIGTQPNALGGGLWRWHAMNPTSGKFGQKAAQVEDPTDAKLTNIPAAKTPWTRQSYA